MTKSSVAALDRQAGERTLEPQFLRYRALLITISQLVLICASYYFSFVLRLDTSFDSAARTMFWETLPLVIMIKLLVFYECGLLRGWWRYVGVSDVLNITAAGFISAGLLYCLIEILLRVTGFPRSVIPIDMALSILAVGGARFCVRAYTERAQKYLGQKRTLIVGAGRAGRGINRELRMNPRLDYFPIGFVDDDPSKKNVTIDGLKVLGTTDKLPELIVKHDVESVLIAIPSAKGYQVEQIVDKCRECKVSFKILPPIGELLNQPASVRQMRKLRMEDLLSRNPVRIDLDKIRNEVQNKVLLITGAGGSIGSELARQVAAFDPRRLVLFERSENDLFKISNELAQKFPHLDFVPVVGDILDVSVLRETFATHHPNSVFHAAAYKHVPMMERNCFQAVTNNIFGTYNVALVAKQFHCDNFVMISSDKAVNPTNIMGVTKRVAELIILSLQHNRTRYIAVRFGNVLGSNGSVLPIFEEQIANGGPVTVTHAEAERYFMTTIEAVQLVLQASTMGVGGDIFVLNMGEPVRIVDLASRLIRLSGLEPNKDIKIVFTGLRPGEKLREELRLEGEGLKPTPHEKIWVLGGGLRNFEEVQTWLDELSALVESRNIHGLISKLVAIVPEYWPSEEIVSLSDVDRHDMTIGYRRGRLNLSASAQQSA
jgi:FlaA1/EpsC-like NDP-sugar epimerase